MRRTPSSAPFVAVLATLPASSEDELPAILEGLPILGCEIAAAGDDRVLVTAYVTPGEQDAAMVVSARLRGEGAVELRSEPRPAEDWLAAYRESARPFPVGSLWWMDPHPDHPTPAPPGRIRLAVEPRSAFGTGSHESTQLILLGLEDRRLDGCSVLDVGTGSGVLALAAMARGADRAVGLDIDPEAVWVARQVAAQQDRSGLRPAFLLGAMAAIGAARFDLVLCNMIPEQFRPLLGEIRRVLGPRGEVVLSGILAEQVEVVGGDLAAAGLAPSGRRGLGEWRAVVASKGRLR